MISFMQVKVLVWSLNPNQQTKLFCFCFIFFLLQTLYNFVLELSKRNINPK